MNTLSNIYSIFNIKDADFYNINIEKDLPLFIQPYTVEKLDDDFARRCNIIAVDFFNTVHDKLIKGDFKEADKIFSSYLSEPKENCFGYSNSTAGKGLRELAHYAMHQILVQPHLINEIRQIADIQLYVDQIMHDRVSDIYTNVTRDALNDYTLLQCDKYGMSNFVKEVPFGPYWDVSSHEWVVGAKKNMLVINNKPILLTPKRFLKGSFGPNTMYRNLMLTRWIAEDLRNGSSLIKTKKNGEQYITKKDKDQQLRSNNFIPSKKAIVEYAKLHPNCTQALRQILDESRKKKK